MDIENANVLPCHRGFQIVATLDALMKVGKSVGLRWHLKVVYGVPGAC